MNPFIAFLVCILWFGFSVIVLTWGTDLFRRILGEEECLPQGPIGALFLFSAGASLLLYSLVRRFWGIAPLPFIFALPLLAAAARSLRLRFAERKARKKEFGWAGDRLIRLADGATLSPIFLEQAATYCCTGPASGYCLYGLEIHDGSRLVARNGYVNERPMKQDVDRLLSIGCKALDLNVVWQASATSLYVCPLSAWTQLVCSAPDTMPEESARFWGAFVRPAFPLDGSVEVATAQLREHSAALLAANPREGERLEALFEIAGPTVRLMTEDARTALEDGLRGKRGRSILQFERGVAKTTLTPVSSPPGRSRG